MVDFNHFNFFKIFSSVLFQNLLLFLYYFIQDLTKNLSYVEWKIRESLGFVIPDSFLCLFCLQFSSVAQLCLTLCDPMDCNTPGFPVHRQLPELAQTQSIRLVMPSNHLILCHSLLLLPSIFPSIRVFSNESVLCIRWPEQWSFSFSLISINTSFCHDFHIPCEDNHQFNT